MPLSIVLHSHCTVNSPNLLSVVTAGNVLTPEDLELGVSSEREHTFVFLGVSYLTQYDLFKLLLPLVATHS